MILNGDRLIWAFFQMLYSTDIIRLIPWWIETLQDSANSDFREILSQSIFFDDFWSEGMYFSVQCSEEVAFSSPEVVENANAAVTPRFLKGIDRTPMFQYCSDWGGMGSVPG